MGRIRLDRVGIAGRVLLLLIVVATAGCGGSNNARLNTRVIPYTDEQMLARETARDARYKLRPGDRFSVAFKYEKELDSDSVLIMPDGYIGLKGLSEPVDAAGMTVEELDTFLEDRYRAEYRDPDLSIMVYELASPEIYVLGAVKAPGLYKLPDHGAGIIQAVAIAGGYNKDAKMSQTVLMRATDEGFMVRTYDLSKMQDDGIVDLSYFDLQPYDIVYIPETGLSQVAHLSSMIFGSVVDVTGFFWDVYALANLDKISTILR